MTIQQKIDENYLLGLIKYRGLCNLYLMPIAYWILDYKKYDPTYDVTTWDFVFRGNILTIDNTSVEGFIKEIEVDKLNEKEASSFGINDLIFYVDFDVKLVVSAFSDIEVDEYLPDEQWTGVYDSPKKHLPLKCREAWGNGVLDLS